MMGGGREMQVYLDEGDTSFSFFLFSFSFLFIYSHTRRSRIRG